MREIAYTKFGRNALFAGLISHVAALLAAMMPSPGSAFFKIVYSFAWLALILGAYVELKKQGLLAFWKLAILHYCGCKCLPLYRTFDSIPGALQVTERWRGRKGLGMWHVCFCVEIKGKPSGSFCLHGNPFHFIRCNTQPA